MEICYHLEPGIWAVRRIGEIYRLSLNVEVDLSFSWPSHVIRETTGSTFHSWGSRRNLLFYWCTTMVDVYCILWPWMFIDRVGWGLGGGLGGGRAVKTVCMSIVFCWASDGVELYLYYVFYVRVKLNSWHPKIEALFKQTGCLFEFFLIADTNSFVLDFWAGQWVGGLWGARQY